MEELFPQIRKQRFFCLTEPTNRWNSSELHLIFVVTTTCRSFSITIDYSFGIVRITGATHGFARFLHEILAGLCRSRLRVARRQRQGGPSVFDSSLGLDAAVL